MLLLEFRQAFKIMKLD